MNIKKYGSRNKNFSITIDPNKKVWAMELKDNSLKSLIEFEELISIVVKKSKQFLEPEVEEVDLFGNSDEVTQVQPLLPVQATKEQIEQIVANQQVELEAKNGMKLKIDKALLDGAKNVKQIVPPSQNPNAGFIEVNPSTGQQTYKTWNNVISDQDVVGIKVGVDKTDSSVAERTFFKP